MKFRFHRGRLDDSMKTLVEVKDLQQLVEQINKEYARPYRIFKKKFIEIKFSYSCYDDRIEWYTWYVSGKLEGHDDFMVIGMADGNILEPGEIESITFINQ